MNCARLQQVLDGELDHATTGEIAVHLVQCEACAALRDQRGTLRQAVLAHAPYFKAPAALAPAVRRELEVSMMPSAPMEKPRVGWLSWWHAAAFASIAALSGFINGYWLAQPRKDDPLRELAVTSQVAALAPTRPLTQVASSDRHTVKPWFQGKIDIAPPIKDLAEDGFELIGGRLDQVADRQAAAVVYQIRKHVINLFVWRAGDRAQHDVTEAIATTNVRRFSVTTWSANGMRFAAVSDVDGRDLTRFAQLISAP